MQAVWSLQLINQVAIVWIQTKIKSQNQSSTYYTDYTEYWV